MQTTGQGLISITLGKVVPVSNFLEKVGLQTIVLRTATYAIRDYQRYISPYKGFSCAHRSLHGGESCSEHFRMLVTSYGLSQAVPLFRQRLGECRQAHQVLKMSSLEGEAMGETDPEADAEEPKKKAEESQNAQSSCGDDDLSTMQCAAVLGDCACDTSEIALGEACENSAMCDRVFALDGCNICDIGSCDCDF